jgi:NADH-quinone oxidoreductase subunit A
VNPAGDYTADLWPMFAFFALAVLLTAAMLIISFFLGQRHKQRQTGKTYEGGIESTGSSHLRFSVKFYLIAMFFVVIDLEAVFLFAWAVSLRETGWSGFVEALIFIIVLAAALVYLWRLGALDIGPTRQLSPRAARREGAITK